MNLGFKDQFCPLVEDGSKRHTMRAGRGRWKVGMRADLFARPRQKGMRLMFRAIVIKVEPVAITRRGISGLNIMIGEAILSPDEVEAFLWRDGFRPEPEDPFTSTSMAAAFWRKQLQGRRLARGVYGRDRMFFGQIIHWDYEGRFMERLKKPIDAPVRSEISNAMLRRVMMPEYLGGRKVN